MRAVQLWRLLLVLSITLGACAAPAATTPSGGPAIQVLGTENFYADLLGMKVLKDTGRQCNLTFGDQGSWLLPRNVREGTAPPRVDHIAYTIDGWDKDAVEAELKRRGLNPRPDTPNSFHVKDPDGYDLQISGKGMTPDGD